MALRVLVFFSLTAPAPCAAAYLGVAYVRDRRALRAAQQLNQPSRTYPRTHVEAQ